MRLGKKLDKPIGRTCLEGSAVAEHSVSLPRGCSVLDPVPLSELSPLWESELTVPHDIDVVGAWGLRQDRKAAMRRGDY